ncbi:hypothetical protein D3C87_1226050 [compost metagenome]
MAEEQVFGDGHFRHQMQLLVNHRDAAADAVSGRLERHGLLADLQLAAARDVSTAEDFQQGRFAGAVLAHQGVNLAGMGDKADSVQRFHPGKGFADPVEAQAAAGAVLFLCLYLRVHKATSSHRKTARLPGPSRHQFHRPIFSSSCLKFSRVIRVTSSIAVYFGGSLPVVTHSYIISAVL